jgi:hypothetical protein
MTPRSQILTSTVPQSVDQEEELKEYMKKNNNLPEKNKENDKEIKPKDNKENEKEKPKDKKENDKEIKPKDKELKDINLNNNNLKKKKDDDISLIEKTLEKNLEMSGNKESKSETNSVVKLDFLNEMKIEKNEENNDLNISLKPKNEENTETKDVVNIESEFDDSENERLTQLTDRSVLISILM